MSEENNNADLENQEVDQPAGDSGADGGAETDPPKTEKPAPKVDPPTKEAGDNGDTRTPEPEFKPENYKIPEGIKLEDLAQFAADTKLTQGQLDAILQYNASKQQQFQKDFIANQKQGLAELQKEWGDEYGGRIESAKAVIKHFDADGELVKLLDTTGMGNHPTVIKFLAHAGKLLKEDGYIKSEKPIEKEAKKSAASVLYPTMAKKEGET